MSQTQAADRLAESTAAVRLAFNWWGSGKTLSARHKAEIAASYGAGREMVTAGKKLFDTKTPAFRRLTALRGEIVDYWKTHTLPYVEDGVRLIRRGMVDEFDAKMVEFAREFNRLVEALADGYDGIKTAARDRLGSLYDDADYPDDVRAEFGFRWEYPNTQPPEYLMRLNPRLYEAERERARLRFEEAVRAGEQQFAATLAELVEHLADRLRPGEDGSRKVFRDSAVTNFREFFQQFRQLNIGSNEELDRTVERAERLLANVQPDQLRSDAATQDRIRAGLDEVREAAARLIVPQARRAWSAVTPAAPAAPASPPATPPAAQPAQPQETAA